MAGYHVHGYDMAERDCCSDIHRTDTREAAFDAALALIESLQAQGFTVTRNSDGSAQWAAQGGSLDVRITLLD